MATGTRFGAFFADQGLVDVHVLVHPNRRDYTYKPAGQAKSRIDNIWANNTLLGWGGQGRHPKSAVAARVSPLSADHAAVAARFYGAFDWGQAGAGSQMPIVVSAQERPRRMQMTNERALRFIVELDKDGEYAQQAATFMSVIKGWAAVARALTLLGMQTLKLSENAIEGAAARTRQADRQRSQNPEEPDQDRPRQTKQGTTTTIGEVSAASISSAIWCSRGRCARSRIAGTGRERRWHIGRRHTPCRCAP